MIKSIFSYYNINLLDILCLVVLHELENNNSNDAALFSVQKVSTGHYKKRMDEVLLLIVYEIN